MVERPVKYFGRQVFGIVPIAQAVIDVIVDFLDVHLVELTKRFGISLSLLNELGFIDGVISVVGHYFPEPCLSVTP